MQVYTKEEIEDALDSIIAQTLENLLYEAQPVFFELVRWHAGVIPNLSAGAEKILLRRKLLPTNEPLNQKIKKAIDDMAEVNGTKVTLYFH